MKRKTMGRSAAVFACISVAAKFLGALYRIPLTNIIGAEGMGLYQMVFPLYTALLSFCGGGITVATSRVVAKYTAKGEDGTARRALFAAAVPLAAVSLISTVIMVAARNAISGLQGNTDAGIAYAALAPSLLFVGGISIFRGYFQGRANMLPSGISQLIEQTVKLASGLYLSKLLLPRGVKYAVCGALIGVTASEFAALAYLAARFAIKRRKRKNEGLRLATAETAADVAPKQTVTDRALLKELYSLALPITLGGLILPFTQIIDSALVINILIAVGAPRADATALFGLLVGPVGTLVNMPTVVVTAVTAAFLPALTAAVETGDAARAERLTKFAAKWILIFVIPVTFAFMLFPRPLCAALYSAGLSAEQLDTAAELLRVQSVIAFYSGVLQLATAALQARGKARRPVINLAVGAAVKVGLTPVLVRVLGIVGASAATAACYAVAATLTAYCAYRSAAIGADVTGALVMPTVFAAAGSSAFAAAQTLLSASGLPNLLCTAVAVLAFFTVYAVGICATDRDIRAALGRHGKAEISKRKT